MSSSRAPLERQMSRTRFTRALSPLPEESLLVSKRFKYEPSGEDEDETWTDALSAATDAASAAASPFLASRAMYAASLQRIPLARLAQLGAEQMAVLLAVLGGNSVFFSGSAGSGKSHLLRLLIEFLPRGATNVTASTGLAAVNIGGTTLHNFSGLGIHHESLAQSLASIRRQESSIRRWADCRVLIVDEVSMITPYFFDRLDEVARAVRNNKLPFGGIQLILTGDFLQLPPVGKNVQPLFTASSWDACVPLRIMLTQVFRQRDDPTFLNLLNHLRIGRLEAPDNLALMRAADNVLPEIAGIVPTKLYALRSYTATENDDLLEKLPGDAHTYKAQDDGNPAMLASLNKSCQAPEVLRLKVGAQVMLLKNRPTDRLSNGSRGVVIGFEPAVVARREGFALSPDIRVAALVPPPPELMPRVRFESGAELVIERADWNMMAGDNVEASRTQLPLTLAWALTIHKSQGMTLDRAEINATGIFEKGQLYVAVSRLRTLAGMRLINFTSGAVRCNDAVAEWCAQMATDTLTSTAALMQKRAHYFPQLANYEADQPRAPVIVQSPYFA